MKGLILDTSSNCPFLLFTEEGTPIAYELLESGEKLSRELGSRIKQFLSARPDFIAIGTGPGSYTGVRVGAAMAKALAFGWQIPLIEFPSLQAFAPKERFSSCAILADAKMGGIYCQQGRLSGNGWIFTPPERLAALEAPTILGDTPLFSPHSSDILKRVPFPQGVLDTKPNQTYLSLLCGRKALKKAQDSFLKPLSLAYLDGKTANPL